MLIREITLPSVFIVQAWEGNFLLSVIEKGRVKLDKRFALCNNVQISFTVIPLICASVGIVEATARGMAQPFCKRIVHLVRDY